MRPTALYGIAEHITRVPENDHQMEELHLLARAYHLEEIGAILHPDNSCNPAATQLVDGETLAHLEAQFQVANHLPPEP